MAKKKQTHILWKLISTNRYILVRHDSGVNGNHRVHPAKQDLK